MLDQVAVPKHPARPLAAVARTVPELFLKRVEQTPNARAWQRKVGTQWVSSSWRDFYRAAASVASFLMSRGIGLGDKVTVVGSTRPEWCISDVGGLLAGAITVGAYPTLTAEQLAYILNHSDSRVVIVESAEQLIKVIEQRPKLDRLELCLVWDAEDVAEAIREHDWILSFADALAAAPDREAIDQRIAEVRPDATAIIVYTSGTTGPPKGAMISHENILVVLAGSAIQDVDLDDIGLVFLPMAHVAERVLSFYGRISYGTSAAYASSVPAVLEEVKEVRPTLFGSVPRIFEKAYARIQSEVGKAAPMKRRIFRWAEAVGLEVVQLWQKGQPLPVALELQHRLADRLVFSKLRAAFGGRVKYFVTGAAPIPLRILEFFWAAGFPIYEVYGMTEATVVTHANRPGQTRLGSVGRALDFVEDKIAEDGEVLIRGKTVFQGYYKDPEATAEAIDKDGWLHTGDIGKKDKDGYLSIVDRKKHIIITAGGKNLTPANIENEIKTQDPIISQVHAHGDRRPYVTAMVTLGPLDAIEWAVAHGLTDSGPEIDAMKRALMENPLARPDGLDRLMAKVTAQPELRKRIAEAVTKGNQKLSRVEQIKRVFVLDRDLSLDEDEVTPTLKIKRKNIEKKFASTFDKLYEDPNFGIVIAEK
jgi:long-chain acyl-CoA synthetase